MSKSLTLIFLLIVFNLVPNLFATDTVLDKPYSWEFSWTHYYYDYKEDVELPLKSSEYGWLDGFRTSLIYRGIDKYHRKINGYGRVLIEYTSASTTYDGSTQIGDPIEDVTNNIFWNLEGDVGITFQSPTPKFDLTPYLGLGIRDWTRKLGGDYPFKEQYTWFYIPLGLRTMFKPYQLLSIELDSSYRIVIAGAMQAFLSDIDSHYNDPVVLLGNKPGWRAEAPISYRFLVLTPWYEYSEIGRSGVADLTYTHNDVEYKIGSIYEPASRTRQHGFNLGFRFIFF